MACYKLQFCIYSQLELNPALSAVLQDTARIAEATDAVCCMYAE